MLLDWFTSLSLDSAVQMNTCGQVCEGQIHISTQRSGLPPQFWHRRTQKRHQPGYSLFSSFLDVVHEISADKRAHCSSCSPLLIWDFIFLSSLQKKYPHPRYLCWKKQRFTLGFFSCATLWKTCGKAYGLQEKGEAGAQKERVRREMYPKQ